MYKLIAERWKNASKPAIFWGTLLVATSVLYAREKSDSAGTKWRDEVTIYRDNYGIPHIVGETEQATFFGFGYAQAQDHLKKMMIEFRAAQGRLSEINGEAALGYRDLRFEAADYQWGGDYLQRLLKTRQTVIEHRSEIDPHVYQLLRAFTAGINCFIQEHRTEIPEWIDSVEPEDVEALQRSYYFRFYSVDDALSKLKSKLQGRHFQSSFGSNQWAITPDKSANGKIIHVENMHMPWSNRFQLYEAHLMTPGKLNVAGICWFGSPFFLSGFNDHLSWSSTWNEPNTADVYQEKLNPGNKQQYLYDGAWKNMRVETATFRIGSSENQRTITLPLYYTHHGPVVQFDRARNLAYSIKLPNFDGVNYSTGRYGTMVADSLDTFKSALARQLIPRWNFLYSDPDNIYWVDNGNVARRDDKFDWYRPVPGWTRETEWGPYLPFESYPQVENPASGFLQNCNNPPWVVTKDSGIKPGQPVPYFLTCRVKRWQGEEALNTRGERVFQVLSQRRKKFTLEEMINLSLDTYILAADVIVPLLDESRISKQIPADSRMSHAVDLLSAWDRRATEDSYAFPIVFYWADVYKELFGEEKFGRFEGYFRHTVNTHSPQEQDMAWQSLSVALNRMQTYFGQRDVRWGEINRILRGGVFPAEGTGTFGVLHPDAGPESANGQISCNDGWGHLMVILEGRSKQVWSLLPYGEAEDPASPHYNDQARLHSERRLKRFWFYKSEILENTESTWGDADRIKQYEFESSKADVAGRD